ncbi:hypothetical protein RHGRI_018585 [Rhododendron griersonianum]|uniref:Aminotransferase-like plant mobile domain-containing protein n=1 Tax=Rhododendron griersonianum TaxID=479676 RepID=A0AAV6K280_9ERIC|nr:hypothetical protein RHGRI_018585 [Rhododendron griersonianum]
MADPLGPDTIFEEREDLMVSPTGGTPTLRVAHFLKPSISGPNQKPPPSISLSSKEPKWLSNVAFEGWRDPQRKWKDWVDRMHTTYQSVWKEAGIYEAVMASTYTIRRNNDLIFGVTERWSSETNSFIFPWGEATITLEDMMVLGGYSVLGHAPHASLLNLDTTVEMREIEEYLDKARKQLIKSQEQKATHYGWINRFMGSGCEFEHEAFLSLWLSRYVFAGYVHDSICKILFPIGVRLARGTRIALAPAVLASLYRDLGLLKKVMISSNSDNSLSPLILRAPLRLVQIWVWERFPPPLRPNPNFVGPGCTELYLPHRVAMQFGFDQDIPGSVSSSSSNPETAWKNYSRPISDLNFVILSRLFESHVTTRYLEWRKKSSVSTNQGVGGTNAELVVKPVEEEIEESEVAKGATETVGDDGRDSRHGRARNNSIWFESAAFELEARISKLEKIIKYKCLVAVSCATVFLVLSFWDISTFLSPTSTDVPLKVEFKGCRDPTRTWKSWFDRMHSIHQSTWKKAGIYEAIVNSTYQIRLNREIVLGFAEKWCSDTNTFVFDWGEGTITLEDVLVLGGYSVLGKSVITPLENSEMVEIDEKLMKGRSEILESKANKADQSVWAKLFMGSGSEIEHEAFLVLWLSRHVFPYGYNVINRNVHSIAIHLARGTRIALAPAILSWLYRDLRRLKNALLSKRMRKVGLRLWAPLQMVQIWAWERFPTLRPQPNPLKPGEPRMARWNKMKNKNIENVGMALNSARECFQWRPYAISEENWVFPKFYIEREEWVSVCLGMDEDFELFARFLRPSELVGLDCLECYLPHRVAMQFGMDQDLPGLVSRLNETPQMAWEKYSMPIKDGRQYVPSRLFKSDVTTRYLEWWKQSKLAQKDAVKGAKAEKSIAKSTQKPPEVPKGKNVENDVLGTPTKRERFKPAKLRNEKSITNSLVKSLQIPKGKKRKRVDKEAKSVVKDKHRLGGSAGKKKSCDGKCFPQPQPQIPSSLTADNGAGKKMENQVEHGENTMRGEAMMGGSHGPSEKVIESHVEIPSDNGKSIGNNGRNISTQSTIDLPGLEARASKLETVFARLKAEKLGVRSI